MIPRDKIFHFAAGFAVALVTVSLWALLGYYGFVRTQDAVFVAVWAAAVAGAIKEVCDWMENRVRPGSHGVEWLDFAATAAGAVPIVFLVSVLSKP
jgi:multidrug resistance efflux pump